MYTMGIGDWPGGKSGQNKSYYIIPMYVSGAWHVWPREGMLCWKPNLEGQQLFSSLYRTLC